MRKFLILFLLTGATVLQFCSSSKNARSTPEVPKMNYEANVKPLMLTHCTPCHFPPKGNKKPYNTYLAAKTDIDEILTRVQMNPGDKGFMPFKHPKLPDSTIQVLAKWKADGLLEN